MKLPELLEMQADPKRSRITTLAPLEMTDLHLGECQAGSPFSGLGLQSDESKMYLFGKVVKTSPNVHGPTMSGRLTTFHPQPVSQSHRTLHHQWLNLNHRIKAYNPGKLSARDRIVGAMVGTSFPKPSGVKTRWEMPDDAMSAPSIDFCAVLWKMAEGVRAMLGQHLSNSPRWSVSIEVRADIEDLGVFLPSERLMYPILEAPEEILDQISDDENGIKLGKVNGEQLVLAYGHDNGKMHFPGNALTPNPAEKTAAITDMQSAPSFMGDGQELGIETEGADGSECFVSQALLDPEKAIENVMRFEGKSVDMAGGYSGKVERVLTSVPGGADRLEVPGYGYFMATKECPLLKVMTVERGRRCAVYKYVNQVRIRS